MIFVVILGVICTLKGPVGYDYEIRNMLIILAKVGTEISKNPQN